MTDVLQQTRTAIVLACDRVYLPFAAFLLWQIVSHSPDRRFDLILASEQELTLPRGLSDKGIILLRVPLDERIDALPEHWISRASYLRLVLPEMLQSQYQRVLYLDSDIWFEGGDLDRLLALDLGGHVIGACRDVQYYYDPSYHAAEFKVLNRPAASYFNSGVMLIDPAAFVAADIFGRCITIARDTPQAMVLGDQSLLNLALAGKFAELAPQWNWMANARLPLAPLRYPPIFRHFIGRVKPWSDPKGDHDARFAAGYRDFFRSHPGIEVPVVAPMRGNFHDLRGIAQLARMHLRSRKALAAHVGRFADEWRVIH
jgi:lipopolysaccharide biosynthesis glycosyltransferase